MPADVVQKNREDTTIHISRREQGQVPALAPEGIRWRKHPGLREGLEDVEIHCRMWRSTLQDAEIHPRQSVARSEHLGQTLEAFPDK